MKYVITTFIVLFAIRIASAQLPQTISYQGVLTTGEETTVPDGNYTLTFKLYHQKTGGAAIWAEIRSVNVTDGVFNVILGKISPFNINFDRACWLSITVGSEPELTPRIELTASPYAMHALTIADSSVTRRKIANRSVVRSVNSIRDDITLVAGENVSISQNKNTITISASPGTAQGNTLDQAYDEGGPGFGKRIFVDSGPVTLAGPDGLIIEDSVGIGAFDKSQL